MMLPVVRAGATTIRHFVTKEAFVHVVIGALLGASLVMLWGEWKEGQREAAEYRRAHALITEEINVNLTLLDENRKTLVADIEAARGGKQVLLALAPLLTDAWRAARVAGHFSPIQGDSAKEIADTYHKLAVINDKVHVRTLFWASSQALPNYNDQRALIGRNLLSNVEEAHARLTRHRDALSRLTEGLK